MNGMLKMAGIVVIICTASMLIGLIGGLIDKDQLLTGLGKTILVIGILVLSGIGIGALTSSKK